MATFLSIQRLKLNKRIEIVTQESKRKVWQLFASRLPCLCSASVRPGAFNLDVLSSPLPAVGSLAAGASKQPSLSLCCLRSQLSVGCLHEPRLNNRWRAERPIPRRPCALAGAAAVVLAHLHLRKGGCRNMRAGAHAALALRCRGTGGGRRQ